MAKKPKNSKDISNIKLKDNYFKNVRKSVSYAIGDVVKKELVPDVYDRAKQGTDAVKYVRDNFSNIDQIMKSIDKRIKSTQLYKDGEEGIKNLKSDLKSGKFYNKERSDRVEGLIQDEWLAKGNDIFSDGGMGDEDFFNEDDIFGGMDDDSDIFSDGGFDSATYNTKKKGGVSRTVNQYDNHKNIKMQSFYMAKDTSGLDVSLAKIGMDNDNRNTNIISNLFMRHTDQTLGSLESINENVGGLVAYNSEVISPFIEKTTQFYEDNINSLKGINDTLSQTFELIKAVNQPEPSSSNRPKNAFEKMFDGGSSYNAEGFKKVMQENLNNMLADAGMPVDLDFLKDTLEMFNEIGGIKSFAANPIGTLMVGGLKSLISSKTSYNLQEINSTFRDLPLYVNEKLLEMGKGKGLGGFIGRLFGAKHEAKGRFDMSTSRADLTKARAFSAQDHTYLTKVIPRYLSEIALNTSKLAGDTKAERWFFNDEKGIWMPESKMRDEIRKSQLERGSSHSYEALRMYESTLKTHNELAKDDKKQKLSDKEIENAKYIFEQFLIATAQDNLDLEDIQSKDFRKAMQKRLGIKDKDKFDATYNEIANYVTDLKASDKDYKELIRAVNRMKDSTASGYAEFQEDLMYNGGHNLFNSENELRTAYNAIDTDKINRTKHVTSGNMAGAVAMQIQKQNQGNINFINETLKSIDTLERTLKSVDPDGTNDKYAADRKKLAKLKETLKKARNNPDYYGNRSGFLASITDDVTSIIRKMIDRIVKGEMETGNISPEMERELRRYYNEDTESLSYKTRKYSPKWMDGERIYDEEKQKETGAKALNEIQNKARRKSNKITKDSIDTKTPKENKVPKAYNGGLFVGGKSAKAIVGDKKNSLGDSYELAESQVAYDKNGNAVPILRVTNHAKTSEMVENGQLGGVRRMTDGGVEYNRESVVTETTKKLENFVDDFRRIVIDPVGLIVDKISGKIDEWIKDFEQSAFYKRFIEDKLDWVKDKLKIGGKKLADNMNDEAVTLIEKLSGLDAKSKKRTTNKKGEKTLLTTIKDLVVDKAEKFSRKIFGDKNVDVAKTITGEISKKVKSQFKEGSGGKIVADAGLGVLASLFLPVGPITGGLLGAGFGLVSNSKAFQKMLFGDSENQNDFQKNMQKLFTEKIPNFKFEIGAGLLGSMFLPGGPIVGGLLGAFGANFVKKNTEKIKETIFGTFKRDKDGNREGRMGILQRLSMNIERRLMLPFAKFALKSGGTIASLLDKNFLLPFKKATFWANAIKDYLGLSVKAKFKQSRLGIALTRLQNGFADMVTWITKKLSSWSKSLFGFIGRAFKKMLFGDKDESTGRYSKGLFSFAANAVSKGKQNLRKKMVDAGVWDANKYQEIKNGNFRGVRALYDSYTIDANAKLAEREDVLNADYDYDKAGLKADDLARKGYAGRLKEIEALRRNEISNNESLNSIREKLRQEAMNEVNSTEHYKTVETLFGKKKQVKMNKKDIESLIEEETMKKISGNAEYQDILKGITDKYDKTAELEKHKFGHVDKFGRLRGYNKLSKKEMELKAAKEKLLAEGNLVEIEKLTDEFNKDETVESIDKFNDAVNTKLEQIISHLKGENPSNTKGTQPKHTKPYQDKNGRWRDVNGRFISDPTKVEEPVEEVKHTSATDEITDALVNNGSADNKAGESILDQKEEAVQEQKMENETKTANAVVEISKALGNPKEKGKGFDIFGILKGALSLLGPLASGIGSFLGISFKGIKGIASTVMRKTGGFFKRKARKGVQALLFGKKYASAYENVYKAADKLADEAGLVGEERNQFILNSIKDTDFSSVEKAGLYKIGDRIKTSIKNSKLGQGVSNFFKDIRQGTVREAYDKWFNAAETLADKKGLTGKEREQYILEQMLKFDKSKAKANAKNTVMGNVARKVKKGVTDIIDKMKIKHQQKLEALELAFFTKRQKVQDAIELKSAKAIAAFKMAKQKGREVVSDLFSKFKNKLDGLITTVSNGLGAAGNLAGKIKPWGIPVALGILAAGGATIAALSKKMQAKAAEYDPENGEGDLSAAGSEGTSAVSKANKDVEKAKRKEERETAKQERKRAKEIEKELRARRRRERRERVKNAVVNTFNKAKEFKDRVVSKGKEIASNVFNRGKELFNRGKEAAGNVAEKINEIFVNKMGDSVITDIYNGSIPFLKKKGISADAKAIIATITQTNQLLIKGLNLETEAIGATDFDSDGKKKGIWGSLVGFFTGNKDNSDSSSSSPSASKPVSKPANATASGYGSGSIPYYSQTDTRWSSNDYASSNLGMQGCGPTAMAMIASGMTGSRITPDLVANYANSSGYSSSRGTSYNFINNASSKLGFHSSKTNKPSGSSISNSLRNGPLILAGSSPDGYGNPYTSSGHYLVATGMTEDGKIIVNDPRGSMYNMAYDPDMLASATNASWRFSGNGNGSGEEGEDNIFSVGKLVSGIGNFFKNVFNLGTVNTPSKSSSTSTSSSSSYSSPSSTSSSSNVTPVDPAALSDSNTPYKKSGGNVTVVGSRSMQKTDSNLEPKKRIWQFLRSKGLSKFGTAGLMGNLQAESGFKSNNLQNNFNTHYGLSDEEYTSLVDNGSIDEEGFMGVRRKSDNAVIEGYGLAQWTSEGRKRNLYKFMKERGLSIADLDGQLNFLHNELSTSYKKHVLDKLITPESIRKASDAVVTRFEVPQGYNTEEVQSYRAQLGQSIYDELAEKDGNGFGPKVKFNYGSGMSTDSFGPATAEKQDFFKNTSDMIQKTLNAIDISSANDIPYERIIQLLENIAANTESSANTGMELLSKGLKTDISVNIPEGNNTSNNKTVNVGGDRDYNVFTAMGRDESQDKTAYNTRIAMLQRVNLIASGQ